MPAGRTRTSRHFPSEATEFYFRKNPVHIETRTWNRTSQQHTAITRRSPESNPPRCREPHEARILVIFTQSTHRLEVVSPVEEHRSKSPASCKLSHGNGLGPVGNTRPVFPTRQSFLF
jgi:hypothetical protein